MHLVHLKGISSPGALVAHPSQHGRYYYTVDGTIVGVAKDDLTNQELLKGHDDRITCLALSGDGNLVASGQCGRAADVILWSLTSGAIRHRLREHTGAVVAAAFSPDSAVLATAGGASDRKLVVWDASTGSVVARSHLANNSSDSSVSAMAWSPVYSNGRYTLATVVGTSIALWAIDIASGTAAAARVACGSVRRSIAVLTFSVDGAWLWAGTGSGEVLTVNVAREALQIIHPLCSHGVTAAMGWHTGDLLVGGGDGSLSVFSFSADYHEAPPLAVLPGAVTSLSLEAGGQTALATTATGNVVRLGVKDLAARIISSSQCGPITGACFAPDQSHNLATSSADGTVCVWDTADYSLSARVADSMAGAATCCALSAQCIFSGFQSGSIACHSRTPPPHQQPQQHEHKRVQQLWRIPEAHTLGDTRGVTALALASRSQFIASGGAGGELRVWDASSRRITAQMKLHRQAITDLKLLRGDERLLASSEDRLWVLWDIERERALASVIAAIGGVRGISVTPDETCVITVGVDPSVNLWDMRTKAPAGKIPNAHDGPMTCCAVSADGACLATGGHNCVVKTWDLRQLGKGALPLGKGGAHMRPVSKVAFSSDGSHLVSCSADGAVAFWHPFR